MVAIPPQPGTARCPPSRPARIAQRPYPQPPDRSASARHAVENSLRRQKAWSAGRRRSRRPWHRRIRLRNATPHFIASAFIEGTTLAATIPEGGTDIRRAARLARELAEALAYAHDQGVVHRDVKPANCLVDAKDRLHLADFGLAATSDDSDAKLTNDGDVLGTPAYMAPEQADGQKGDAQPAADQYAAGVVLYELLTGRTPFTGPPAVVIYYVLNIEPERPSRLRPGLPAELEAVCLKAMDKNPAKRYPSCVALADDLERWADGRSVVAKRPGPIGRTAKWAKRNPAVAGLMALVMLTMSLGSGVSTWQAGEARDAARLADANAQNAWDEQQRAEASENLAEELAEEAITQQRLAQESAAEAKLQQERAEVELQRANIALYAGDIDRAEWALKAGDTVRARQYLEQCPPQLSGWEHDYLWSQFDSHQTLAGHARGVSSICVSPDGRWIVSASRYDTSKVWDAETGRWIVSGRADKKVKVWDAETGRELRTLDGHTDSITSICASPDGRWIVTGSGNGSRDYFTVKVWDAETGRELRTLAGHAGPISSVCVSPDGRWIVSASSIGDNTSMVWDSETGRYILSGSGYKTVKVWGAETGRELLTLDGHIRYVTSVCVSPDGRRIVSGSGDITIKVWTRRRVASCGPLTAILTVLRASVSVPTAGGSSAEVRTRR